MSYARSLPILSAEGPGDRWMLKPSLAFLRLNEISRKSPFETFAWVVVGKTFDVEFSLLLWTEGRIAA